MAQGFVASEPARPGKERPRRIIEVPFLPERKAGLLVDILGLSLRRNECADVDVKPPGVGHQFVQKPVITAQE